MAKSLLVGDGQAGHGACQAVGLRLFPVPVRILDEVLLDEIFRGHFAELFLGDLELGLGNTRSLTLSIQGTVLALVPPR